MKNKKKNQVAYHLVNTRYVVIWMNEEGKNRLSRNEIGSGWAFAQPEFAQTTLILVFLTFMTACFCSLNILWRQLFHCVQCTAHNRNLRSLFSGGTVGHWKHWIPRGLKNVKEEYLEGAMDDIPWKTSWSICSYVFSQCMMKTSKKMGCIHLMHCMARLSTLKLHQNVTS